MHRLRPSIIIIGITSASPTRCHPHSSLQSQVIRTVYSIQLSIDTNINNQCVVACCVCLTAQVGLISRLVVLLDPSLTLPTNPIPPHHILALHIHLPWNLTPVLYRLHAVKHQALSSDDQQCLLGLMEVLLYCSDITCNILSVL